MNGDGEPEYMKPNVLMETGSVFGSASEDEEENDHRQLRQEQPEREDAHEDEESEDDGAQSSTTGFASGMSMLALGTANQMGSDSDSEEDEFDAP